VHVRVDPTGQHRKAAQIYSRCAGICRRGERRNLFLRDADSNVPQDSAASIQRTIGDDDDRPGRWRGRRNRGDLRVERGRENGDRESEMHGGQVEVDQTKRCSTSSDTRPWGYASLAKHGSDTLVREAG
jgi:hypothetical protein